MNIIIPYNSYWEKVLQNVPELYPTSCLIYLNEYVSNISKRVYRYKKVVKIKLNPF